MPDAPSTGGGAPPPKPTATRKHNIRSRRSSAADSPWAAINEAAQQMAARFTVDNAMQGVVALDTAAESMRILGTAFQTVGTRIGDEVDWDKRVEPFFHELGNMLLAAAKPTEDGAAAVRAAEAERIRNVEEGGSRRRKWDVSAHD
jgi:hypothetical protein